MRLSLIEQLVHVKYKGKKSSRKLPTTVYYLDTLDMYEMDSQKHKCSILKALYCSAVSTILYSSISTNKRQIAHVLNNQLHIVSDNVSARMEVNCSVGDKERACILNVLCQSEAWFVMQAIIITRWLNIEMFTCSLK